MPRCMLVYTKRSSVSPASVFRCSNATSHVLASIRYRFLLCSPEDGPTTKVCQRKGTIKLLQNRKGLSGSYGGSKNTCFCKKKYAFYVLLENKSLKNQFLTFPPFKVMASSLCQGFNSNNFCLLTIS